MLKRKGVLFCLVGPAGSGKTTVAQRLLELNRGTLNRSISVTSRPPRASEQEGADYCFVSREAFQARAAAGEFFEWEEIHENLYGTPRATVDDAVRAGRDLLLAIDIKGALSFKRSYPLDTVITFITPPAIETLKTRLRGRAAISEAEFARRLQTAEAEYAAVRRSVAKGGELDYFLLNDELEATLRAAQAILDAERIRVSRFDADGLQRICTTDPSFLGK